MAEKKKFAFYWMAGCGGCEVSILDIHEKILDVVEVADILFWPVAMDIKYSDVEKMQPVLSWSWFHILIPCKKLFAPV